MERHEIVQLFEYHHWAGDRVMDAIATLTASQLDEKWGGSFGTGRALVQHVVGVERLWTNRWNGEFLKALPTYPASYSGTDFRTEWQKVRGEQRDFVDELSQVRLSSDLTYQSLEGQQWTLPLAELLRHLVNHGTYHRGQIVHLLRDLGVPAPSTDYLLFVRERRNAG